MSKRSVTPNSATHICSRCGVRQIATHHSGMAWVGIMASIVTIELLVYIAVNGTFNGGMAVSILIMILGVARQIYVSMDTRCCVCCTPCIVPLNTPGGRELSARFPEH